jgi:hypothetical protein
MRLSTTILFLLLVLTLSLPTLAQEASDSLIGIVSTSLDAAGNITGATLEAETYDENDNIVTIVYQIEMNDTGKQLAEKFDGAEVKVTGTIKIDNGTSRTISVTSYESSSPEVPEEPVDEGLISPEDAPDIDVGSEDGGEIGTE